MLADQGSPGDGDDDYDDDDHDSFNDSTEDDNCSQDEAEEEAFTLTDGLAAAMAGVGLDEQQITDLAWPELCPASSDRCLEELCSDPSIWSYSVRERLKLTQHWELLTKGTEGAELDMAHRAFEEAREQLKQKKDEACYRFAAGVDIIGCTTNGAAKLASLLGNIRPKVLLVEEAAEILEAHVLASMPPSVEHMLLIGDPRQLRPHISNYSLSMESKKGQLYRLDLSLMERLVTEGGIPVTQLNVQRRMRVDIADLVRSLYCNLQDHKQVAMRADVRGFHKNLVFMDHCHGEDKTREMGSRSNEFEVCMAVDLVRYLYQAGYRSEGDICVLTPYLGQLSKLRRAMANEVIKVVVDTRDEEQLALAEGTETPPEAYMSVKASCLEAAVRIATIDNFQGEEARIVVLSLVRNVGALEDDEEDASLRKSSIGFLKSPNRSNVALSRAKEGLFIMGNADLLSSKSEFWRETLATLHSKGAVMSGFPVSRLHQSEHGHRQAKPDFYHIGFEMSSCNAPGIQKRLSKLSIPEKSRSGLPTVGAEAPEYDRRATSGC
ncbi:hypothetical protein ACQY0O_000531 [Thecaphora frezii]